MFKDPNNTSDGIWMQNTANNIFRRNLFPIK